MLYLAAQPPPTKSPSARAFVRQGKDDVGRAVAEVANALSDEDLVHNVVERVDKRDQRAGEGRFEITGKGAEKLRELIAIPAKKV